MLSLLAHLTVLAMVIASRAFVIVLLDGLEPLAPWTPARTIAVATAPVLVELARVWTAGSFPRIVLCSH